MQPLVRRRKRPRETLLDAQGAALAVADETGSRHSASRSLREVSLVVSHGVCDNPSQHS